MQRASQQKLEETIGILREADAETTRGLPRVLGDAHAIMLLDAWTDGDSFVKWQPSKVARPELDRIGEINGWLWSTCEIDYQALSFATGLPVSVIKPKIAVLVSGRLIYPDNTVADRATSLVESYAKGEKIER